MPRPRSKPTKQTSLKTELRFHEFARCLQTGEPTVKELVAAIESDRSFPAVATWQELRWHLNKIGAPHNAFIGGRLAWQRYKLELKKRARVF